MKKMLLTLIIFSLLSTFAVAAQTKPTAAGLRAWISTYMDDVPNFICDYTEKEYRPGWAFWKLHQEHEGEVRHIDGRDDYLVKSVNGDHSQEGTPIWKLSGLDNPFAGFLRDKLRPETNYRFKPKGKDKLTFVSDWGRSLLRGYTENGELLPGRRNYPSWGTIWVDKETHGILKIKERFKVPRGDGMFNHGEHEHVVEYGKSTIGDDTYLLPRRAKYEEKEAFATPFGFWQVKMPRRIERVYQNCRRFEAEASVQFGSIVDASSAPPENKKYDTERAAAQPGFKQAPGGRGGGELPTPMLAHETGLEVIVEAPSAQVGDLAREDAKRQEAPQGFNADEDRLSLPKAARFQWRSSQMPRELYEWITAYISDLPNFICDYSELEYTCEDPEIHPWRLRKQHRGEVRYIDGLEERQVVSMNGKPSKKPIWKVSRTSNFFGSLRNMLDPEFNYRLTPTGPGKFTFQSDSGMSLHKGFTRKGKGMKRVRSYPTKGTLLVDEDSGAVLRVLEDFWVHPGDPNYPPAHHKIDVTYEPVRTGESSYWLPTRDEIVSIVFSLADDRRIVRTYENCRRFQVKSTIQYADVIDALSATPENKKYDTERAAAQPGFKQAAGGGRGGELPTPTLAHETGLEVDADLDSAQLPNLSPQDHPPATSQPPLSKAVRTSPSEDPPTPRPSQTTSRRFPKRYGYKSVSPQSEEDRGISNLTRYGYYPSPTPPEPEDKRVLIEKDQADDQSVFWWFVSMAAAFGLFVSAVFVSALGAFAFIRVFGGKASADFLWRKSADAPEKETKMLTAWEVEAKKHWTEHRPRLVKYLSEKGVLRQALQTAAENAGLTFGAMARRGVDPWEAQREARIQFLLLPSEEDVPMLDPDQAPFGQPEPITEART